MVKVMFIKASRLYVEHATDFRIWAFMPIEINSYFMASKRMFIDISNELIVQ